MTDGAFPGVKLVLFCIDGRVVELAYTTDLKSVDRKVLRVQVPPRLPVFSGLVFSLSDGCHCLTDPEVWVF